MRLVDDDLHNLPPEVNPGVEVAGIHTQTDVTHSNIHCLESEISLLKNELQLMKQASVSGHQPSLQAFKGNGHQNQLLYQIA